MHFDELLKIKFFLLSLQSPELQRKFSQWYAHTTEQLCKIAEPYTLLRHTIACETGCNAEIVILVFQRFLSEIQSLNDTHAIESTLKRKAALHENILRKIIEALDYAQLLLIQTSLESKAPTCSGSNEFDPHYASCNPCTTRRAPGWFLGKPASCLNEVNTPETSCKAAPKIKDSESATTSENDQIARVIHDAKEEQEHLCENTPRNSQSSGNPPVFLNLPQSLMTQPSPQAATSNTARCLTSHQPARTGAVRTDAFASVFRAAAKTTSTAVKSQRGMDTISSNNHTNPFGSSP